MKILDNNEIFEFDDGIIFFDRFKIIINKEYGIFFIIFYEDLIKNPDYFFSIDIGIKNEIMIEIGIY
jgi:hypothetical protein